MAGTVSPAPQEGRRLERTSYLRQHRVPSPEARCQAASGPDRRKDGGGGDAVREAPRPAPPAHLVRGMGVLRMAPRSPRSEERTSELQSLMRISYAVFCLKKKK